MGGGKSRALCEEALDLCLDFPGNIGFIGRKDLTDLKKTTLKTLLEEVIPADMIASQNKQEKEIVLINGSKIIYGELKDIESLRSLNLGFFVIDEATEVDEKAFHMLRTRLRLNLPGIKRYALLASNPTPGWVKRMFVDRELSDSIFVKALPRDNPYLPDGYEEALRETLPELWIRRYLEGDWSAFEGQVYPEFDRRVHVIDPFDIPAGKVWQKFGSIDFGLTSPTAVLAFAVDFDGNVFVYDEYYRANATIEDHVSAILEMGYKDWYMCYIDPATSAKTRETKSGYISVRQELAQYGIYTIPANHDILAGISAVSSYLRVKKDRIHPITGKRGSPSLFIFSHCKNLINELEDYCWAEGSDGVMIDRPAPNQSDHAVDALRYFLVSRPSPRKEADKNDEEPATLDDLIKKNLEVLAEKNSFVYDYEMGVDY